MYPRTYCPRCKGALHKAKLETRIHNYYCKKCRTYWVILEASKREIDRVEVPYCIKKNKNLIN